MNPEQLRALKKWVEDNPKVIRDWLWELNSSFRQVRISPNGIPAEEVQDVWDCTVLIWEMVEKFMAVAEQYE